MADIAEHNHVHVHMTITTVDEKLARMVEPMAPRPELRLRAVRRLADAGIGVTVLANPVMPFITDSPENLDAVCAAAAEAGAVSFSGHALFLKPCSKAVFLPFIEERFPHLAAKYRQIYAANAYLKPPYTDMLAERVRSVLVKHGLQERRAAYRAEQFAHQQQLSLW
jgi:DNA repair photolyase